MTPQRKEHWRPVQAVGLLRWLGWGAMQLKRPKGGLVRGGVTCFEARAVRMCFVRPQRELTDCLKRGAIACCSLTMLTNREAESNQMESSHRADGFVDQQPQNAIHTSDCRP